MRDNRYTKIFHKTFQEIEGFILTKLKLRDARTFHFFETEVHFSIPVIISALGYFVDIYDLLLFGIVRIPSLKALGLNPDTDGTFILNAQMVGLLIGGIFWGVFGDKKGRLSVLFGSILVYSLANIACGFTLFSKRTFSVSVCRIKILAGIGLAGELGAGITLVSKACRKI